MKYFLISSLFILFLLCQNNLLAQMSADEVVRENFLISTKKHGEQNSNYQYLKGEEARDFNVEKFIADNIHHSEIIISGKKISYGKTMKIEFDSRDIEVQNDCNQFCKSIVTVSKIPIFGLTVSVMDDLQGVLVETVYEGSSAEIAGIEPGDMITYVADSIIQSGCDLLQSIGEVGVGEVLDIFIEEDGNQEILPIILGYKIQEIATYDYCCNSELNLEVGDETIGNEFSIFPNPTDGITQLKFQSGERTDLEISLTDVAGHQIFKSEVKDFNGFYNEVLDLTDYAAGLYFVQIMQGEQVWTEKIVLQNIK
ncbi:MAG: T9SS type A sorting domain-containing protein [Saprospiraceae bacterium]